MPPNNSRVALNLFTSIFGIAIGFGVSQLTLVAEVKQNSADIRVLRSADMMQQEMTREVIKQNQEFIQLLKVQNELMHKTLNKIP